MVTNNQCCPNHCNLVYCATLWPFQKLKLLSSLGEKAVKTASQYWHKLSTSFSQILQSQWVWKSPPLPLRDWPRDANSSNSSCTAAVGGYWLMWWLQTCQVERAWQAMVVTRIIDNYLHLCFKPKYFPNFLYIFNNICRISWFPLKPLCIECLYKSTVDHISKKQLPYLELVVNSNTKSLKFPWSHHLVIRGSAA